MTARTTTKGPAAAAIVSTEPPAQVSVDITSPHAVYFDGDHRTGTIDGVPYSQALYWLRRRWATCAHWSTT